MSRVLPRLNTCQRWNKAEWLSWWFLYYCSGQILREQMMEVATPWHYITISNNKTYRTLFTVYVLFFYSYCTTSKQCREFTRETVVIDYFGNKGHSPSSSQVSDNLLESTGNLQTSTDSHHIKPARSNSKLYTMIHWSRLSQQMVHTLKYFLEMSVTVKHKTTTPWNLSTSFTPTVPISIVL